MPSVLSPKKKETAPESASKTKKSEATWLHKTEKINLKFSRTLI